jgi:hypothetical protein
MTTGDEFSLHKEKKIVNVYHEHCFAKKKQDI